MPPLEPGERWVPVDRRLFGIDRRSIPPAIAVLTLAIVLTVVVPSVNEGLAYREEVAAGDVIELGDGITFVPEPGWGITAGVRRGDVPVSGYPEVASVIDGDTTLALAVAEFDGDADALLTELERVRTSAIDADDTAAPSDRRALTTEQGHQGVAVEVTDAVSHQLLAAFVVDDIGLSVVATQPALPIDDGREVLDRMITSIRFNEDSP